MKKKVAIFFDCNYPFVGGMSKGLSNFLAVVNYDDYDVDLHVLGERALFLPYISKRVNIRRISFYLLRSILSNLRKGQLSLFLRSIYIKIVLLCLLHRMVGKVFNVDSNLVLWWLIGPLVSKVEDNYDVAVAYSPDMLSLNFVTERLRASRKVTFIHTDISTSCNYRGQIKNLNDKFCSFDYVFCVSDSVLETAKVVFPDHCNKFITIKNIISKEEVLKMANVQKKITQDDDVVKVTTIARVDRQKGIHLAIDACEILKNKGYKLCWYVIGNTHCKVCQQLVKTKGLSKEFIFVGADFNPLPYVNECDIYVQPSLTEGYCMALDEALMLHKPAVVTNLPVFRRRLTDMKTALFADFTSHSIAEKIECLIKDKELRDTLIENTLALDFDTSSEVEKIYCIINK